MRTVVLGPPPPELAALIARRRELGLDMYDEVWDGEYHMAPMAHSSPGPFNLGQPDDFRVPDAGLHRGPPSAVWVPTAALVVEIESPDDETWDKLPYYTERGVPELLIVSGSERSVTWLDRSEGEYREVPASRVLGPDSGLLGAQIDWPATPT